MSSNTGTSESTNDGLSGRDGHTSDGSDSEEDGGSDLGATHGEHEGTGYRLEGVEGEDTALDGSSDSGSESDSTEELSEAGQNTSLPHLQGPRSHGRGVGVGDIVGTVGCRRGDKGDGGDR